MATFTSDLILPCTADQVFEFLRTPANRVRLAPPDAPVELVEGPPLLKQGSSTTWKLKRFGVSQTLILEVTACAPPKRLVEEQRQGPFGKWVHSVECMPHADGALVRDTIEYEPPGGILGVVLNAKKLAEMLKQTFAWRDRQLRALLNDTA